ncbi:MAG: hypothetical protein Q8Q20_02240 [bacterium]|nr:hypothetical protein [bacterium]
MADVFLTVRVVELGSAEALLEVNGQRLRWPREQLPSGASVGDSLQLFLQNPKAPAADNAPLAKAILNEILTDDNPEEA